LRFEPASVRLVVEDDGHGFDTSEAMLRGENDECIGLKSMRERVQLEGGRISITSGPCGTTVEVELPC